MKPTQEQVIAWAREARFCGSEIADDIEWFTILATLAYEAGRKDENEAAIEDARTVGGEAGVEMEKLIRARREQ